MSIVIIPIVVSRLLLIGIEETRHFRLMIASTTSMIVIRSIEIRIKTITLMKISASTT